ncbi:MAG: hypothetical protein ACRDP1_14465 [Nocardioidaceae bacterium]
MSQRSDDIIEMLWPRIRDSVAGSAAQLRGWQEHRVDDQTAQEIAHQLAGTLGSYRRTEGGAAARQLELRLSAGNADRTGAEEDRLIGLIEAGTT